MGEWEDPRALYMCNWVLNSLKFKADKWKKMVNVEECKYVQQFAKSPMGSI